MEKSWNVTNKFLILTNRRWYTAAFQNPSNIYIDIEVMEKSWNFVTKIS